MFSIGRELTDVLQTAINVGRNAAVIFCRAFVFHPVTTHADNRYVSNQVTRARDRTIEGRRVRALPSSARIVKCNAATRTIDRRFEGKLKQTIVKNNAAFFCTGARIANDVIELAPWLSATFRFLTQVAGAAFFAFVVTRLNYLTPRARLTRLFRVCRAASHSFALPRAFTFRIARDPFLSRRFIESLSPFGVCNAPHSRVTTRGFARAFAVRFAPRALTFSRFFSTFIISHVLHDNKMLTVSHAMKGQ